MTRLPGCHEAHSEASTQHPPGSAAMDVPAFQRTWIDAFRQKERSAYVTHFNDRFDPRFFAITEVARELDRSHEN